MPWSARGSELGWFGWAFAALFSAQTVLAQPADAPLNDESSESQAATTVDEAPSEPDTSPPAAEGPELPLEDLPLEDMPLEADAMPLEADSEMPDWGEPSEMVDPRDDSDLGELFGHFGFELRMFPRRPSSSVQPRYTSGSLVFKPGYSLDLGESTTVRGIGFVRLDQHDTQRSHFDAREALVQTHSGALTATLGINKVFWGVTESRHLVDIVNQTDYLEEFSGDEKLGQLMAVVAYDAGDWGLLDAVVATWFRPQRYPSREGRPGVPLRVLHDSPVYESELERWQPDVALRWSHSIDAFDWALSYFYGTSREPQLLPVVLFGIAPPFIPFIEPALEPRYDLIHQVGFEWQWTLGAWLYKIEGMYRSGQGSDFAASTLGFEYTLSGALGGGTDLGLILEYNYDGRDNATFNIYDNDAFGGLRISPNDEASSEFLLGALTDLESGVTSASLEASRRFGQHWKLALLGRTFFADDEADPLYWFRRDHYGQVTVEYHF